MCFVWCCPGQQIKVSKLLSIPFSWSNIILLWVLTLGLFLAFVLMSHFPYNGDCHSMWTTSWYTLEVSSKGMLKSNCCCDMLYGARRSEQWQEWDIMTLVDKCCYLQAGLILIGVTLPHKRTLLFVCSLSSYLLTSCHTVMSAVIRQWECLLWKASELGEGMSCSWSPSSENQKQSPRRLNLSGCTSWALGQWLWRSKLMFSAADAKAQFPQRALATYPSIKVHRSLDFSLLRKYFQFHEVILHSSSKQLGWRQLVKSSCTVSSADWLLLLRLPAALEWVWGVLLWLFVS